jgi:c(7)-type cytochrome triheme protein
MIRIISVLSIILALSACKFKGNVETKIEEPQSPVISSLKDSGLPCFKCHSFDRFSQEKAGLFSHEKHKKLGIHCNTCHIIKEHKESNVNKDACNSCHNLTTFSYSSAGMPASFSHQGHSKKFGCNECHPKLFLMKKGSTKLTMDEMYKGSSCGTCHNGKKAFASTDCAKCHSKMTSFKKEIKYPSKTMSAVSFGHELHTAMFKCDDCHTKLFKYKKGGSGMKMDDLYQGKFCAACHNGQSAFSTTDCQRCHK